MKNGKSWTGKEHASTTALGRGKGNIPTILGVELMFARQRCACSACACMHERTVTCHRQHIQLLEVRTGGVFVLVVPALLLLSTLSTPTFAVPAYILVHYHPIKPIPLPPNPQYFPSLPNRLHYSRPSHLAIKYHKYPSAAYTPKSLDRPASIPQASARWLVPMPVLDRLGT